MAVQAFGLRFRGRPPGPPSLILLAPWPRWERRPANVQMFSLLSSTAALRLYSFVKHERARFKGAAFLWRSGPNEGTAQWTTLVLRARLLSLLPGASPHLRLTFGTRSCNDDCVREPESVYNGTFGIREKTGPFFVENRLLGGT